MTSEKIPGFIATPRAALRKLGLLELALACAGFAVVVVLNCVQIALRMFTPWSIWWAQEVSQLASLVAYFMAISVIYKLRQDVVMIFLWRWLPARLQLALFFVIELLIATFVAVVTWQALRNAPMQLRFMTYILAIPKFYSTLPLIVASVSMLTTACYHLVAVGWAARSSGSSDLESLEQRVDIMPELRLS